MGKRKRAPPSRTCPDCDELVHVSKKACPCGHVFVASALTIERRARADKKRAAAVATVADSRRAAAVAASKLAPGFLRDSSTKPDTSTKPSLVKLLRLEPTVHPGTKEGFPEYVATRIISCLQCPGTDAERVYEPPYVDYYARLVARCKRERRPLPRLPRPDYVIRKKGELHSEVQALYVACGHGFDILVGTRGMQVGGHFTRVQRPTKEVRLATPALIAGLGPSDARREVLEPWPTPAVDSDTNGLLLQPRRPNAWAATSARFTCSPPRHFCNIRELPFLRLPASPYSTLAGELPMFDYIATKDERRTNSYLLTIEAPLDEAAFLRRLSRLDSVWLAKVRGLREASAKSSTTHYGSLRWAS